jgi:hypothetical protein
MGVKPRFNWTIMIEADDTCNPMADRMRRCARWIATMNNQVEDARMTTIRSSTLQKRIGVFVMFSILAFAS